MQALPAIYKNQCPRCHGDITSERLAKGEFCDQCMSELQGDTACDRMGYYRPFCTAEENTEAFNCFFRQKVGDDLSPIQRMWAKRYFTDHSFAMLAPTGIGKTTFGLLLAAFVRRAYLLFPTRLLVMQARDRLRQWGFEVLAYTGKKREKQQIERGEYDILITTTQFLYKNRDLIRKDFSLVFVDDVDSILKSGRRITDVLSLVGFSDDDLQKALRYIERKEYDRLERLASRKKGNLIVSSATAQPRSRRILLFRYLLGFEVSRPNLRLRRIEDVYDAEPFSWDRSVEWIRKLGPGGLLFLPGNETRDTLEAYTAYLNRQGIRAYTYEHFKEHLDEFRAGRCYFTGFASYRNPLARGIDLPEAVRYSLFVGVPKMEFQLRDDNPRSLYFISLAVFPYLIRAKQLTPAETVEVREYIRWMKDHVFLPRLRAADRQKLDEIARRIRELIRQYETAIRQSPEIGFDGQKIITADITGYIQASGRSSRFYKGHLTQGLGLVLVDNDKAFYSLRKKLHWFTGGEFRAASEVEWERLLQEIDRSRQSQERIALRTTFVVVESPTKAKTIASFYGRPGRRILNGVSVYEILLEDRVLVITASIGHDFDLIEDEARWGVKDRYIPIFRVLDDKDRILEAMHLSAAETAEVFIATDPDREGEKIAFDLTLNNKPYNPTIRRAEFHEITKRAFEEALAHPRTVDTHLVAAQFVRRIADRWIGFRVSQYLQAQLHRAHLSAGRVQTPVLKWIAERTEQLKEKIWTVRLTAGTLQVEIPFERREEAVAFMERIPSRITFEKTGEQEEVLTVKPFTTSEMLKEASRQLHFTPQQTMQLAQELFERGFITYHRTDSHHISPVGIRIAREYIVPLYGEEYFRPRRFAEGGAHEAIRPTSTMDRDELQSFLLTSGTDIGTAHLRLYDLIFRRFMASQMKEVKALREIFRILDYEKSFLTRILEDGFNLVWPVAVTPVPQGPVEVRKELVEKSKYPPYTYADIIQLMKERGIGRPSTYAVTVEKLLERKYVVERKGHLFATRLGFKVIELVEESAFKDFVNEEFTARLEQTMDEIEAGRRDYKAELENLYSRVFGGEYERKPSD